jgi:heat shock protein HslJ
MMKRSAWLLPAAGSVLLLLMTACTASPSPSPLPAVPTVERLDGTSWQLLRMGDQDLPEGVEVTLELAGGQASGSAGCNQYSGAYAISGASIDFGPLVSTEMACPEPAMAFESEYLAALEAVTSWAVPQDTAMGTQLTLIGAEGSNLVYGPPTGG